MNLYGLITDHVDLDEVAAELQTTAVTIRTIISEEFRTGGDSTPLDIRTYAHFLVSVPGFLEYCKENRMFPGVDE